jgi:hypothetical protein
VAKKTFIRAMKYPNPVLDKALAECKADKSWSTFEMDCGHVIMLDAPQWLAYTLIKSCLKIEGRDFLIRTSSDFC